MTAVFYSYHLEFIVSFVPKYDMFGSSGSVGKQLCYGFHSVEMPAGGSLITGWDGFCSCFTCLVLLARKKKKKTSSIMLLHYPDSSSLCLPSDFGKLLQIESLTLPLSGSHPNSIFTLKPGEKVEAPLI